MTKTETEAAPANVKIKFLRDTTKLEFDDLHTAGEEISVVQDEADHWVRLGAAEIVNGKTKAADDEKAKAAAAKR